MIDSKYSECCHTHVFLLYHPNLLTLWYKSKDFYEEVTHSRSILNRSYMASRLIQCCHQIKTTNNSTIMQFFESIVCSTFISFKANLGVGHTIDFIDSKNCLIVELLVVSIWWQHWKRAWRHLCLQFLETKERWYVMYDEFDWDRKQRLKW